MPISPGSEAVGGNAQFASDLAEGLATGQKKLDGVALKIFIVTFHFGCVI